MISLRAIMYDLSTVIRIHNNINIIFLTVRNMYNKKHIFTDEKMFDCNIFYQSSKT